MIIKDWYLESDFNSNERYAIEKNEVKPEIKQETEKAVLVVWNTEYGAITKWVPKSAILFMENTKQDNEYEDVDYMMTNRRGDLLHIVKDNGKKIIADNGKEYLKMVLTLVK